MKGILVSVIYLVSVFTLIDANANDAYVNLTSCEIEQHTNATTCSVAVEWSAPSSGGGGGGNPPYEEPRMQSQETIDYDNNCLYHNSSLVSCQDSGNTTVSATQGHNFFRIENVQETNIVTEYLYINYKPYTAPFIWTEASHNEVIGDFEGDGDLDIFVQPKSKESQAGVFPQEKKTWYNDAIHKGWTGAHPNLSIIEDWSSESYKALSGNFNASPGDEVLLLGKKSIVLLHGDVVTPIVIYPEVKNAIVEWNESGVVSYKDFLFNYDIDDFTIHVGNFDGDVYSEIFLQSKTYGGPSYILENDGALIQTVNLGYLGTDWSTESYSIRLVDTNGDGIDELVMTSLTGYYDDNVAYIQNSSIASVDQEIMVVATSSNLLTTSNGPSLTGLVEDDLNVGVIPSSSFVDASGAFNYSIPILTTTAIQEMAPQLALSYNSGATSGMMGPGWSISGLSSIHRCGDQTSIYAKFRSVNFDSKRFCLDGQKLKTSNQGSTYYIDNSYSEIKSYGIDDTNPDYFEVTHKDGSKTVYGKDTSNIIAINADKTYAWSIYRHIDINGNYVEYKYQQTSNDLEYYPKEVLYNANLNSLTPKSKIVFNYTNGAIRPKSGYAYGENLSVTKRLSSVESYSNNYQLRSYTLGYDESNKVLDDVEVCNQNQCLPKTSFKWITDINKSPSYFGTMNGAGHVSRADDMGYKLGDLDGDGIPEIIAVKNNPYNNKDHLVIVKYNEEINEFEIFQELREFANSWFRETWQLVDLNQDNKLDLLFGVDSNWAYIISNGEEFDADDVKFIGQAREYSDHGWDEPLNYGDRVYSTRQDNTFIADISGDGSEDFVYLENGKYYFRTLERRTINRWGSIKKEVQFRFSLPKSIRFSFKKYLADASSESRAEYEYSVETSDLTNNTRIADFNSDGHADIWVKVTERRTVMSSGCSVDQTNNGSVDDFVVGSFPSQLVDRGSNSCYQTVETDTSWRALLSDYNEKFIEYAVVGDIASLSDLVIVDINGDGLTDVFFKNLERYRLNTGNGFTDSIAMNINNNGPFYRFADFNGDGVMDVFHHAFISGTCRQAVSINENGVFSEAKSIDGCWRDDGQTIFSDFNKDGFTDYLTYDGHQNHKLRGKKPLNKIYKVIDGYGKETLIGYKPLTDSSVYEDTDNVVRDFEDYGNGRYIYDVVVPTYVVHTYHEGVEHFKYKYYNWKAQAGIGSLGFGGVKIYHANTGLETYTGYRQYYPYTGQVRYTGKRLLTHSGEFAFDFQCDGENYVIGCDRSFDNLSELSSKRLSSTWKYYEDNELKPGNQIFAYKTESKDYEYTDEKLLSEKISEITELDAYGNVIEQVDSITDYTYLNDKSFVTQTSSIYDYYSSFYGGRKTSATVVKSIDSIDSITRKMSFYYDALGRVEKTVKEEGDLNYELVTEVISRDIYGNIETSRVNGRDIESRTNRKVYDVTGRFVLNSYNNLNHETVNSLGSKAKAYGYVDSTTGPNGIVTSWTYSELGRKKSESSSDGSATSIKQLWCANIHNSVSYYDSSCPINAVYVEITQGTGSPTQKEYYDAYTRVIRSSKLGFDGEWINVDSVYDDIGRLKKKSQPYIDGDTVYYTEFEYDTLGRVVTTTRPDQSDWYKSYYGYSVSATNPNGLVHTETKNARGELIKVRDIHEAESKDLTTTYKYDAFGNLIELDGPLAGSVDKLTVEYDQYGYFKLSMDDPNKGYWEYQYDQLGQLTWQKNSSGQELSSSYDKLGRLTRKTTFQGVVDESPVEHDIAKIYDESYLGKTNSKALGLVSSEIDYITGVEKQYFYDELARNNELTTIIDGRSFTQKSRYDSIGRNYLTEDATGKATRYYYNEHGYMYAYANNSTNEVYWQATEGDEYGNVTFAYLSNAKMLQTAVYDSKTGLVERIQSGKVNGTGQEFQDEEYFWDNLGNLDWRKDYSLNGRDENFSYDGLNRLKQSTVLGQQSQVVRYDDSGNITYKSDVGYYCYNSSSPHAVTNTSDNQCSGSESIDYEYDEKGNMINGRGRVISYTSYDKPKVISSGGYQVEFSYGPDYSRYKKVESSGGVTTTTLYVGNVEFISKSNESGEAIQRHVNGQVREVVSSNGNQGNYIFKDHLGSVVYISTKSGAEVERFSFDSWGKRRPINWSAGGTSFSSIASLSAELPMYTRGYTGHEQLDDVGLIHMNGRIYDPVLARFLSADPYIQAASNQQSLNRYSYVLNNPLNMTDPSGYFWVSIGVALVASAMSAAAMTTALSVLSTVMTLYSYYSTYQAVVGVMQTYSAWRNGAGGAVWGQLAKGLAKSYLPGYLGLNFGQRIANAICDSTCWSGGNVNSDKPVSSNLSAEDKKNNIQYSYAQNIYERKCVAADSCQDGANFYGINKNEISNLMNRLETDSSKYNVNESKSLINRVRNSEHPIIFAKYPKSNSAIAIDSSAASVKGKGSPVVILLDFKDSSSIEFDYLVNGKAVKASPLPEEVLAHEVFHGVQMTEGVFSNMKNYHPKKYGTGRKWEIEAIDAINKIRKNNSRIEYNGSYKK